MKETKKTNKCPKCGSTELERGLALQSGGPFTMLYRGMFKDWVKVEGFVCKQCGYCELWVSDKHMAFLKGEGPRESPPSSKSEHFI